MERPQPVVGWTILEAQVFIWGEKTEEGTWRGDHCGPEGGWGHPWAPEPWLCRAPQSIITTALMNPKHKRPSPAGSWFLLLRFVFINLQPTCFLLAPFFSASEKFPLNHCVLFPLVKIKVNEIPVTASHIQLHIHPGFYMVSYTAQPVLRKGCD